MLDTAYQTIKKYNMIKKNDCIVMGISGGADSISLFHFLCTIQAEYHITLIGVHIHHGIRGKDADSDLDFVVKLCALYNIKCEIFKYNVHNESEKLKITEEEAGRIIRYKTFQQVLEKYKADKIAVAHNMNDQCETIIMRIFRGTGMLGLTGIPPIRNNIIRPLIETSRDTIEQYCKINNFEYRQDYTNDMDIYTRNKIRLHLIPWIKSNFNHSIIQTISNMSSLIQEEEDYINNQAKQSYENCVDLKDEQKIEINIKKFEKYPTVIQKRIIRLSIQNFIHDLKDIEFSHITQILNIINKNTGKKINITHGIIVEKQYDVLCLYFRKDINTINYCYDINLNGKTYIKENNLYITSQLKYEDFFEQKQNNLCTKVFDYDKIGGDIKIRNRLTGDKIYLKGSGNKKLKDFFIDIKLPRQQRDKVALLATGNNIIWILGYRVNSLYNVDENTKRLLYIEYREEKIGG